MDEQNLHELAKVYAASYASPHHITFTLDGLKALVAALSQPAAADEIKTELLGVVVEMLELADNWPGVAYTHDLESRVRAVLAKATP